MRFDELYFNEDSTEYFLSLLEPAFKNILLEASPFKIKEIIFTRNHGSYIIKKELIDDSEYGGNGKLEMLNAYNENGDWIGDSKTAKHLSDKFKIKQFEKVSPKHSVCSIGYSPTSKKWYGWSHRAICGFKIGDKLFDEYFSNDDKTPFIKHGSKDIKTLEDAKLAASRFSRYVS